MTEYSFYKDVNSINEFIDRVIRLRNRITRIVSSKDSISTDYRDNLLSDETIGKLLFYSFYASLRNDEGRQTKIRLYWSSGVFTYPRITTLLQPIELSDEKVLTKLAQGIHPATALYVEERDGVPFTSSIVLLESPSKIYQRSSFNDSPLGMEISVRGPGHILFSEYPFSFTYKNGQILKHSLINQNHLVTSWIKELNFSICNSLRVNKERRDHCAQSYSIEPLLRALLRDVIEQGHGGMLVIIPEKETELVKINYPTRSTELRESLMRHWESLYETRCVTEEGRKIPEDNSDFIRLLSAENHSTNMVNQLVRGMSHLANMDGCLVFDRELTFLGFGGVIQAQNQAASSKRRLRMKSGFSTEEATLGLRGTRHRSAYQLCKAVPDAIAFVVSQDGDLRIFASDMDSVLFQDNVHV